MMEPWDDESDERSFIHRHRAAIGLFVGLAALACVATLAIKILGGHGAAKKTESLSMVRLLPPPPPPRPPVTPPPTPEPQPKEQPMIEQKQMMVPETKPVAPLKRDEAPTSQNKAPAGPLGMNAKGEGAGDSFGLVGRPGGNGLLGDGDGGGGGGTRWGWYAGEVQATIEKALRDNPRTRAAAMRVEVKIWPDKIGRITRVELDGSTGEPALDAALKNEVLNGLQLQEPPPSDMPLPIVMRLTARRPQ
jgi:periplasmic protein TonB